MIGQLSDNVNGKSNAALELLSALEAGQHARKLCGECPENIMKQIDFATFLLEIPANIWKLTEIYFFPYSWFVKENEKCFAKPKIVL